MCYYNFEIRPMCLDFFEIQAAEILAFYKPEFLNSSNLKRES